MSPALYPAHTHISHDNFLFFFIVSQPHTAYIVFSSCLVFPPLPLMTPALEYLTSADEPWWARVRRAISQGRKTSPSYHAVHSPTWKKWQESCCLLLLLCESQLSALPLLSTFISHLKIFVKFFKRNRLNTTREGMWLYVWASQCVRNRYNAKKNFVVIIILRITQASYILATCAVVITCDDEFCASVWICLCMILRGRVCASAKDWSPILRLDHALLVEQVQKKRESFSFSFLSPSGIVSRDILTTQMHSLSRALPVYTHKKFRLPPPPPPAFLPAAAAAGSIHPPWKKETTSDLKW